MEGKATSSNPGNSTTTLTPSGCTPISTVAQRRESGSDEPPTKRSCIISVANSSGGQSSSVPETVVTTVLPAKQEQKDSEPSSTPMTDAMRIMLLEQELKTLRNQSQSQSCEADTFRLDEYESIAVDAPLQKYTPPNVIAYQDRIRSKLLPWVSGYHWYAIDISLPCVIDAGVNLPMVAKIPGDKIWNGKKNDVADQSVAGNEMSSAFAPKLGFMVTAAEKKKVQPKWPAIALLQSLASKLAGENRCAAVFFDRCGVYQKTPSHYHIIMGTTEKWAKINLRNELTSTKMAELSFKRFNVTDIAALLVHHCQPRPERQFIGASHAGLASMIKVVRENWNKCVGTCETRIYNGIGDLEHDEAAPATLEGWNLPGADGSKALVEVGVSLHSGGIKQQIHIDYYKTLFRQLPIKIYSVDQVKSAMPFYYRNYPKVYPELRKLFTKDKGQGYRLSLMADALSELAIDKICTPLRETVFECLAGITVDEIEQVIECLTEGPIQHMLHLICFAAVITRRSGKMNAALVYGEPNAGKSTVFLDGLDWLVPHWSAKGSMNPLTDKWCFTELAYPQRIAFIDEFGIIGKGCHDYFKALFGGQTLDTDQKYKGRVQTYSCPFVLMSNKTFDIIMSIELNEMAPFQSRVYVMELRCGDLPQIRPGTKFYRILWMALLPVIEEAPAPANVDGAEALRHHYRAQKDTILNECVRLLSRFQQSISSASDVHVYDPDNPSSLLDPNDEDEPEDEDS